MLSNAIADIGSPVVAKLGGWRLEVDGLLDTSEIASGQISRSSHKLRQLGRNRLKNDLRVLA
jgi:hypothetical protein